MADASYCSDHFGRAETDYHNKVFLILRAAAGPQETPKTSDFVFPRVQFIQESWTKWSLQRSKIAGLLWDGLFREFD